MSNEIDKKLFGQIFGHTPIKLADKLINTINKEENQIIINSINKNNDKLDNNGCKYILFTNDIYFSEYFLAVELDEKGHTDRDFVFEKKRQKALEKNLVVNLLELIQVIQKVVMISIIRLVIQKHLLMSSKIKNKRTRKRNKRNNLEQHIFWVQKLYKEFQTRKSKNDK